MSRYSRVAAVYRKELLNLLRDHRTMIAMVLVPVVLYPMLMLGFVRTMEIEQAALRQRQFVVEVNDEQTESDLARIVESVRQTRGQADEDIARFNLLVGNTRPEALGDDIQLHVTLDWTPRPWPYPRKLSVGIAYNEINVLSRTAMEELTHVLDRYGNLMTRKSLEALLPAGTIAQDPAESGVEQILHPVRIETSSAATEQQRGGWALGLIIPVILVIMTITGAIYPAIDVTAGERERGTLEALLATPAPILHLIVAKFLVVATIGLFAAGINVASVGATMHFGGLTETLAAGDNPVKFPIGALPIVVLCMVPFALLSSAVLVAVCSFARSFKEAQNYVMPVIIVSLIPAVIATLPSVRLEGIMLVLPVGNMVLLTRELFQQTSTWPQIVIVLLSTTLYAAAAIAIATRLFGQEAVLFTDAGSWKTLLRRRLFKPRYTPALSQALLLVALLFPAVFFVQQLLSDPDRVSFIDTMKKLASIQFLGMFIIVPVAITAWLKADIVNTFRLRMPPLRAWPAALLLGLSTWLVAIKLYGLQARVIPPSEAMREFAESVMPGLLAAPLGLVLLLMAVTPAVSEEMLFRGFVLSGVGSQQRKWTACIIVGVIFGVFHGILDKVPVTALLGVMLAYVCWQSRSIFPAMIVHAVHNAMPFIMTRYENLARRLGIEESQTDPTIDLPTHVWLSALVLCAAGLAIFASIKVQGSAHDYRRDVVDV